MKKTILIFLFILISYNLYALAEYEARLYGSRILICDDNVTVRYWTLFNEDNETKIFNNMNKRSYSLDNCRLFKCSSNPSSFNDCVFPDDKRPADRGVDDKRFKQP